MKTISRDLIIKAIETEPLAPGAWVDARSKKKSTQGCKVCAVGAVIRQCLNGTDLYPTDFNFLAFDLVDGPALYKDAFDEAVRDLNDDEIEDLKACDDFNAVTYLLDEEKYFGALSVLFEQNAQTTLSLEEQRKVLVEFVKRTFPEEIDVPEKAQERFEDALKGTR